jgi:hypothetical protein
MRACELVNSRGDPLQEQGRDGLKGGGRSVGRAQSMIGGR